MAAAWMVHRGGLRGGVSSNAGGDGMESPDSVIKVAGAVRLLLARDHSCGGAGKATGEWRGPMNLINLKGSSMVVSGIA